MNDNRHYSDNAKHVFKALTTDNCCKWPREAYRPSDLLPHQHEAIRAAYYRSARKDGLSEEDAEEAASWAYSRWFTRDYTKTDIGRGDHLRAYASTRAYARITRWKGVTGCRRQANRKISQGIIERKEIARQQHDPRPDAFLCAEDRFRHSSKLRGQAHKLMRELKLSSMDGLLRMAAGLDGID